MIKRKESFADDPCFSDPMLQTDAQLRNHLQKAIEDTRRYHVFGVYTDGVLVGLFSFLTEAEEHYAEMLVGLSRSEDAYREMLTYLQDTFPAYQADFVLNPRNTLLCKILQEAHADFETEQYKMILPTPATELPATPRVMPYSEAYRSGYLSIHDPDGYWTAEKVLEAPDRFRVFLALCDGNVAGYLDVTQGYAENEIYDLFVCEKYRKQGYGKELLAAAIAHNHSEKLTLTVDVDNESALALYRGAGFTIDERSGNLTAHLQLNARKFER